MTALHITHIGVGCSNASNDNMRFTDCNDTFWQEQGPACAEQGLDV
jgi:hypothetical protein